MCFKMLMAAEQANAQAIVNRARYKARDASNEKAAAQSAAQKWGQSLRNQKVMKAAGERFNAMAGNLGKRMDAQTMNSAMGMLAHSEDMGRVAAAAASAGVGGNSVEAFNRTMETSYAMQKEVADRGIASENFYAAKEMGTQIQDAVDSMDNNLYMASLDLGYKGETGGVGALGLLATIGVAAAASAAGAPEVGQMVMDMKTSSMQANYGVGDGGGAAMSSAFDNFKSGVGQVRDMFRSRGGSSPSPWASGNFDTGFNPSFGGGFAPPTRGSNMSGSITFR